MTNISEQNDLMIVAENRILELANNPKEFFDFIELANNGRVNYIIDLIFEGDSDEFWALISTPQEAIKWLKKLFDRPKVKKLLL